MDILAVPQKRQEGWYLPLMAPNTKGPKFAWLDPSRIYCNSQALSDCVKDLLKPFQNETIDLVAWASSSVTFSFVAGMEQHNLNLKDYVFTGKISAVISPFFVGIAAWLKENYKYSHCIPNELQSKIDSQYLESFKNFSG
uniref:Uncharacterized protein n=1 Tax=Cyprinus carpio TaxID=7962 RepID=A0A8C1SIP4_CYPCA